jgi:hypothetical protein
VPRPRPYNGQTYGHYAVRVRADAVAGYKAAWLLWPDGPNGGDWNDGENWVLQTETTQSDPTGVAVGNVQIDWVSIWSRPP